MPSVLDYQSNSFGRGRSWSADNGAPCDTGWDSYTSGWAGVKCNKLDGRITSVDAGEMGVSVPDIQGDISGWEALTEAEYMCDAAQRPVLHHVRS
jgi:hypothetical protein